jgi:predicted amidohydrolase YtcJ
MNPFALLAAAGVGLAFGSDAPATPPDPWGAVRAAMGHHSPASRIGVMEALTAHTLGGYRAAAATNPLAGTLLPGAPASYAIWDGIGFWGTGFPVTFSGADLPCCLRTVHRGQIVFERDGVLSRVGRGS